MAETQIEWTDATWNPVAGCSIVSAGCTNCYAMQMAKRLEAMNVEKYDGLTRRSGSRTVWNGIVREDEAALDIPSAGRSRRKSSIVPSDASAGTAESAAHFFAPLGDLLSAAKWRLVWRRFFQVVSRSITSRASMSGDTRSRILKLKSSGERSRKRTASPRAAT
jgi:Protein of unknown function (DUF5131)